MNILVVAAHPDDEVLGCGGTVARLAREGHKVRIAILGEGITARYPERRQADTGLMAALRQASRQVAQLLGSADLVQHELPDNRFDTVPLLEVVKIVENLIRDFAPEVIYTHHGGDLNIDHRIVHQAVLTAARPLPGQMVREIYAFEVSSSTEWAFYGLEPFFRANVLVDISGTLDLKLQALSLYETEARPFPHPRSPEALRALARRWGSVAGCQAAEAFALIRAVR
jgi:LmbE family N-acetylglucosaminyl deacetylase